MTKQENQCKRNDRKPYNGIPVREGEQLVPMVVNDEFLELNDVSSDCVRTWQMAGITYKVVFYAVSCGDVPTAMQQYHSQVNDLLGQVLGNNRDARCMIPQTDGSFKLCPKKNGDNRVACRECPCRNEYERENKEFISIDELKDNYDFDIPDKSNVEDEVILKQTLQDLFRDLKQQDNRSFQILTLLIEGHSKQKIIELLGLKKSRGYQEIDNAKETLKKYFK